MKLEVGMYVRTDLGNIGKIVEEYTHQNNKVSYPEPQEWVLDTGFILNEAVMYKNEEIIKASHNIIDLIEVGDYVNGSKVININYDLNYDEDIVESITVFDYSIEGNDILHNEDIKSIVTKEIFENISYEVK